MLSPSAERPTSSALAGVVEQLHALRSEHAHRQALNEELFRSLSSDPSIDASERQSARVAAAAAQAVCDQVDAALRAVAEGSYGSCTGCQQPIPVERLEAVPLARTCVSCPPS